MEKSGKKWERIHGFNLDVNIQKKTKENKNIIESENFKNMCELAGIPVTKRQAVKFKNKRGLAYKTGLQNQ